MAAGCSKANVLLLFIFYCFPHVCMCLVCGSGFVVQYLVFFLVLQSSCRRRESWLISFNCVIDVVWTLMSCFSYSRCLGLVYGRWVCNLLVYSLAFRDNAPVNIMTKILLLIL